MKGDEVVCRLRELQDDLRDLDDNALTSERGHKKYSFFAVSEGVNSGTALRRQQLLRDIATLKTLHIVRVQ